MAKRIILDSAVTETQWQTSFSMLPVIHMLSCNDQHRWRELAIFFMYHKSFTGAGGDRIHSAVYSPAGLFSHTQSKRPTAATPPPRSLNLLPYWAKSFFEKPEVVEHLLPDVYTRMKAFFRQDPNIKWSRENRQGFSLNTWTLFKPDIPRNTKPALRRSVAGSECLTSYFWY